MIVLSKTVAPFITRKVEKKWFGFVGGGGVFGWLVGFFVLFCCFVFFFLWEGILYWNIYTVSAHLSNSNLSRDYQHDS